MDIIEEINNDIKKLNEAHEKMMRGIENKFYKEQSDDNKINYIISNMIMDLDNLFARVDAGC